MEMHMDTGDHDAVAAFGRSEDKAAKNLLTAGIDDDAEE